MHNDATTDDLSAAKDADHRDWFADVLDLYRATNPELIGSTPALVGDDLADTYSDFVWEEWAQFNAAIDDEDIPALAGASTRLIAAVLATCVVHGIDLRPIWSVALRNVVAKAWATPGIDTPGPVDLAAILARQEPLEAR